MRADTLLGYQNDSKINNWIKEEKHFHPVDEPEEWAAQHWKDSTSTEEKGYGLRPPPFLLNLCTFLCTGLLKKD
jgi:hypothetical protein